MSLDTELIVTGRSRAVLALLKIGAAILSWPPPVRPQQLRSPETIGATAHCP